VKKAYQRALNILNRALRFQLSRIASSIAVTNPTTKFRGKKAAKHGLSTCPSNEKHSKHFLRRLKRAANII